VRKCLPNLNSLLEIENQTKNVKGHSGRRSFITNGLNAGVAPEIIAQSTKHKDSNTLMSYAEKSDLILGSAGLQLNKKLKQGNDNTFAGHSTSTSMIEKSSSSSSSSSLAVRAVGVGAAASSSSSVVNSKVANGDEDGNEIKNYTFNFNFN
jgi:hypothetical protein